MKKNKAMRLASLLLVLVLMTSSIVSGTFAKYTTSVESKDSARVAKWGFTSTSITLDNLFAKTYERTEVNGADLYSVKSSASSSEDFTDVIAPGTTGSATFGFTFDGEAGIDAPEVDYTFVVSTAGSLCDSKIAANANIQWKLDNGAWGTWAKLIEDIEALDGNLKDNYHDAGTLPAGFAATGANEHTVSWQWIFYTDDTQDETDTEMGNMTELDDVKLVITITATQVD